MQNNPNKKLKEYIQDLVDFEAAKSFYSLDEIHQDQLVSLMIDSLDGDVDIVLSHAANRILANHLKDYDADTHHQLMDEVKKSVRDDYSSLFDQLIREEIDGRKKEKLYSEGFIPTNDPITGEIIWKHI